MIRFLFKSFFSIKHNSSLGTGFVIANYPKKSLELPCCFVAGTCAFYYAYLLLPAGSK